MLKFCPTLTRWKTPEEYRQRMAVIARKQEVIDPVSREAAVRWAHLDLFQSGFMPDEAEMTPDLLAMDCFHPSRRGQQMIARLWWESQPWFH